MTRGREQQVCIGTRPAGFRSPFPSPFFATANSIAKAPSGLSNSAILLKLCLYPDFLEPCLVSGSARRFSKGEETGLDNVSFLASLFSTRNFFLCGFFFSSLLINVLGPVLPTHAPVMETLLISSALACHPGADVSPRFL